MPQEPSEPLRRALNEMESLRKRSILVTRLTLYPSLACFIACILTLLFSANKWLGMTWGIMALFGFIGALGTNISASQSGHTQRILKAIEILSERVEAAGK